MDATGRWKGGCVKPTKVGAPGSALQPSLRDRREEEDEKEKDKESDWACGDKVRDGVDLGKVPVLGVLLHTHARANQVAVAVDVVDAADGGPEFEFAQARYRERRLFARIRPVPIVRRNHVRRVRRVLE